MLEISKVNRLRRMAERRGLRLEKNRRRDPGALLYGTYQIVRGERGGNWRGQEPVACGPEGYGLSLEEVEKFLVEYRPER